MGIIAGFLLCLALLVLALVYRRKKAFEKTDIQDIEGGMTDSKPESAEEYPKRLPVKGKVVSFYTVENEDSESFTSVSLSRTVSREVDATSTTQQTSDSDDTDDDEEFIKLRNPNAIDEESESDDEELNRYKTSSNEEN